MIERHGYHFREGGTRNKVIGEAGVFTLQLDLNDISTVHIHEVNADGALSGAQEFGVVEIVDGRADGGVGVVAAQQAPKDTAKTTATASMIITASKTQVDVIKVVGTDASQINRVADRVVDKLVTVRETVVDTANSSFGDLGVGVHDPVVRLLIDVGVLRGGEGLHVVEAATEVALGGGGRTSSGKGVAVQDARHAETGLDADVAAGRASVTDVAGDHERANSGRVADGNSLGRGLVLAQRVRCREHLVRRERTQFAGEDRARASVLVAEQLVELHIGSTDKGLLSVGEGKGNESGAHDRGRGIIDHDALSGGSGVAASISNIEGTSDCSRVRAVTGRAAGNVVCDGDFEVVHGTIV